MQLTCREEEEEMLEESGMGLIWVNLGWHVDPTSPGQMAPIKGIPTKSRKTVEIPFYLPPPHPQL